ncbi:MAG: methylated-DNA--[protein]-cysteine S-methyltransferase [Treponema sp.]|nr:methylated-DNA--[protein]-cysteine S-methyltransferase [Treponema sp.]
MQYTQQYVSPLGTIVLACDDDGLIGLWFEGQKYFARVLDAAARMSLEKNTAEQARTESHATKNARTIFKDTTRWLDLYFSGTKPDFTPPLHFLGTPFQKDVWGILCEIPYGQTTTYGEIARRIAKKKKLPHLSAQAVGGAVGKNEISIIVPCHRVVGTNGSLTGYAGGIDKKIALLKLENAPLTHLFRPKRGTAL